LGVKDLAEKSTNSMICIGECMGDAIEKHIQATTIIEADELSVYGRILRNLRMICMTLIYNI